MDRYFLIRMHKLRDVIVVFFKLGCIAFGGPVAHIAMLEQEVVEKRKWMTREHFLDLISLTHLIPGPNSTEMAIFCGRHYAGWPGLILAGVCFIFPAFLITLALGIVYAQWGTVPDIQNILTGLHPAILAIIAGAVWKLGKKAVSGRVKWMIAIVVGAAVLSGLDAILVLISAGLIGALGLRAWESKGRLRADITMMLLMILPAAEVRLHQIFTVFAKIGAILFGSGYVLVAYLDTELVQKLRWLTEQQLLDAIAIGQMTPGPVLTTATFVGYQLHGFPGAVLATVGIFLPSFLFVMILAPILPKMKQNRFLSLFLGTVTAGVIGLMAAVVLELAGSTITNSLLAVIFCGCLFLVFRFPKLSSLYLLIGSSTIYFVLSRLF